MPIRPFIPDYEEIAATVARLEAEFEAFDSRQAEELMSAYRSVSEGFAADLSDPRDLALSKGGALMPVKTILANKSGDK